MKMKSVLLGIALLVTGFSAQAAKIGMAGCGLGSLVFEDEPGMIQIVAVTLNATGVQTSALTTGSSNCVPSALESAQMFTIINHVALQKEISQGRGESIETLASLLECGSSSELATSLKKNYDVIYGSEKAEAGETFNKIETVIDADASLQCKVLS